MFSFIEIVFFNWKVDNFLLNLINPTIFFAPIKINLKKNMYVVFFFKNNFFRFKNLNFFFLITTLFLIFFFFILKITFLYSFVYLYTCIFFFFYWLLSGFVFFYKKYFFSRYTTSIQRFWRRSILLFWLLELFLFSIYLYFLINSSSEIFYFFDTNQLFNLDFISIRSIFFKNLVYSLIIISVTFILVFKKNNNFSKSSFLFFFLNFFLIYIFFLELSQFLFVCNTYVRSNWVFDFNENVWCVEHDVKKQKIAKNYFNYCCILKFWHVIFAVIFWLFTLNKICEKGDVSYDVLAINLQNFIFIYILGFVNMFYCFKFYLRFFLDLNYVWFSFQTFSLL